MMKGIYSDPNYRAISVIALIQICVVAGGVLSVSGIMKVAGYGTISDEHFRMVALLIRRFGLAIFAVPTLWAFIGIKMIRTSDNEWVHRIWQFVGIAMAFIGLAAFAQVAAHPQSYEL